MKKYLLKTISVILAFSIVFMSFPLIENNVYAGTSSIQDSTEMGSLCMGFNMLDGVNYIDPKLGVYNTDSDSVMAFQAEHMDKRRSEGEIISASSVSSYMEKKTERFKGEVGLKAKAYMIGMELKLKYGIDEEVMKGQKHGNSIAISNIKIVQQHYYTGVFKTDAKIKKLWDNQCFNKEFVNGLLGTDGMTPEDFFQAYGTHIITDYDAGGEMYSSYIGHISETEEYGKTGEEAGVSAGIGCEYIGLQADLEVGRDRFENQKWESVDKTCHVRTKGGSAVVPDALLSEDASERSDAMQKWIESINEKSCDIVDNDQFKFVAVWDLLKWNNSYTDRRIELQQYFNENFDKNYADFYNQYVYSPTEAADYNGYTLISTADDLRGIRDNPEGNYVLLNNVDLKGEEWIPVGTYEKPFTGIFDGNGNTISGFKITNAESSYVGLFGFLKGKIKNLDLEGEINAEAIKPDDKGKAYIGGIVGYNNGAVFNCRNRVKINGNMSLPDTAKDPEPKGGSWFEEQEHIDWINHAKTNYKSPQTLNYNAGIDAAALKISGKLNHNIVVHGRKDNGVAFIVLENAVLNGQITGTTDQEICIISMGNKNEIIAPEGKIAIDVSNSDGLYITGEAPLIVYGGKGFDGSAGKLGADGNEWGSTGAGNPGSNGKSAGNGKIGLAAVLVKELIEIDMKNTNLVLNGGNGGLGGTGGRGGDGGYAHDAGLGKDKQGRKYGKDSHPGGIGGTGGNGGNGGEGGKALSFKCKEEEAKVEIYNGNLEIINGNGGNGGAGGAGGNGGKGSHNSWICSGGGTGGNGGEGGTGGNGSAGANSDIAFVNVKNKLSYALILNGKGGDGGQCGNGGAKGKGDDGTKSRGADGQPGGPGYQGKSYDSLITETSPNANVKQVIYKTAAKEYTIYHQCGISWEGAKNLTSTDEKLISVNSKSEQKIIEKMMQGEYNENYRSYWIGLHMIGKYDNANGTLYQWEDGSKIKIKGTGPDARICKLDENNQETDKYGYANFYDGEPNNYDGHEGHIHIRKNIADGEHIIVWNDRDGKIDSVDVDVMNGYITEKTIKKLEKDNSLQNALFVGGICGYNSIDGQITDAYNTPQTEQKAYAIEAKAYAANCGVSTYTGGITGYNRGALKNIANKGKIIAKASSDSMISYANAYARGIASNNSEKGTIQNYISNNGIIKDENNLDLIQAKAESVNSLINNDADAQAKGGEEDPTDAIERYWRNSKLTFKNIDKDKVYAAGSEFDKNTIALEFNGITLEATAFNVISNLYEPGISTVTLTYIDPEGDNERIYKRNLPVRVVQDALIDDEDAFIIDSDCTEYKTYKNEFLQNSELDVSGLIFKLTYNSGTIKYLVAKDARIVKSGESENGEFVIVCPDMKTAGVKQVRIIYRASKTGKEYSCQYDITVIPNSAKAITITKLPTKHEYFIGDSLDIEGIEICKQMKDGTSVKMNAEELEKTTFTYNFLTLGKNEVYVRYGDLESMFEVNVKPLVLLTVEKSNSIPDGIFTTEIVIKNNPGILGAALTLTYDSKLTLLDASSDEGLKQLVFTCPLEFKSGCKFLWDGTDSDNTEGVVLKLKFHISNSAQCGQEYAINVSMDDLLDDKLQPLDAKITGGSVKIEEVLPGDVNKDNKVNIVDVVLLRRYITTSYTSSIPSISLEAANVNKDGRLSVADVILLRQYIAGGYGVTLR